MKDTLNLFKKHLIEELQDVDFSSLYEDVDILSCIKEYEDLQNYISNQSIDRMSRKNIEKEMIKIEKECLKKIKAIKIIGEDKNYYLLKNEPYDSDGILIDSYFESYLEDDDIFCEYKGDTIYTILKNCLDKKIDKVMSKNNNYFDEY